MAPHYIDNGVFLYMPITGFLNNFSHVSLRCLREFDKKNEVSTASISKNMMF